MKIPSLNLLHDTEAKVGPKRRLVRLGERYFYIVTFIAAGMLVTFKVASVTIWPPYWLVWLLPASILFLTYLFPDLRAFNFPWIKGTWLQRVLIQPMFNPFRQLRDRVQLLRKQFSTTAETIALMLFLAVVTWLLQFILWEENLLVITWPILLLPLIRFADRSTYKVHILKPYLWLTLFAVFTAFTSLLYHYTYANMLELADLVDIFIVVIWLMSLSVGYLFIMRRTDYYLGREYLTRQLVLSMFNNENPKEHLTSVCQELVEKFSVKAAFILVPDDHQEALHVAAGYGAEESEWQQLKIPLGLDKQGVTNRVFLTGKPDLVAYSQADHFIRPKTPSFQHIESELAARIERDGILYGVLDLQSENGLAFYDDDLDSIVALAQALALAFSRQEINQTYQRVSNLMHTSKSNGDPILLAITAARTIMKADLVIYYELAAGTAIPRYPPRIIGQFKAREPVLLRKENQHQGVVPYLIRQWSHEFIEDVELREEFTRKRGEIEPFVNREGIKSMCFIPVGIPSMRIGAVFLNWRTPQRFSSGRKLALMAFTQAITPFLQYERHLWHLKHGFYRDALDVHAARRANNLGKSNLQNRIEQLKTGLDSSMHEQADSLFHDISSMLADILTATSSFPFDSARPLDQALNAYKSNMIQAPYFLNLVTEIQPDVLREGDEINAVLFRIIQEAINNAASHGDAHFAEAKIKRKPTSIRLEIKADCRLPDIAASEARRSKHGLFELLDQVKEEMSARVLWDEINQWMYLTIIFPALPVNFGVIEETRV